MIHSKHIVADTFQTRLLGSCKILNVINVTFISSNLILSMKLYSYKTEFLQFIQNEIFLTKFDTGEFSKKS